MKVKTYKCPEKAPGCYINYRKVNSFQKHCFNPACAYKKVNRDKAAKEKKTRVNDKKRLEELQPVKWWIAKAQKECNAFIRKRDEGQPCISCGNQRPESKYNAGHWLSVGSTPELRFHPFNINLQCEHCNTHLSGNASKYRVQLAKKIGEENVEWLEGPHELQRLTIEDVKDLIEHFKELQRLETVKN